MPPQPQDPEAVGIGELSRQVQQVLMRFEGLATRLETQFIRKETYDLYKQLVDQAISSLQEHVKNLSTAEATRNLREEVERKASKGQVEGLEQRVTELEDDRKWLIRLVLGFIVLSILGAIFVVSKGGV